MYDNKYSYQFVYGYVFTLSKDHFYDIVHKIHTRKILCDKFDRESIDNNQTCDFQV